MRTLKSAPAAAIFAVVGLAAIAGCKQSTKLVPVEGNVTLDGKPLANAAVLLSPTRGNGPGPFFGTTKSDGRFSLGPAGNEAGGAMPDSYIVAITTLKADPNSPDGSPPPGQKEVVPARFRDGSERFVVPEGGNRAANFNLKTH
jgi:hypothetical protein